jgi:heme/copper-type cytochrome/quinol oxidase subunit 1
MPLLTRWFLRTSLLSFVLALLLGVIIAARAPLNLNIPTGAFSPIFFHLFMVGWVAQLIFGVVFWMFPKYSKEKPRGSEKLGWAVFWLLNLGLLLRVIGEPAQLLSPGLLWGWMLAVSALFQWLAGVIFVINTWGRVKER